MSKVIELQANLEDAGNRLDSFVTKMIPQLTRSAVQKLISEDQIKCDGYSLKKNYKLNGVEKLMINIPDPQITQIVAENIPLDVVYEDTDIIVVNKCRGMVVHPAAGNWSGTLVNALMYHCGSELSGINGEIRPGIVHRIDKDTSGLLVVAKNDFAHQRLAEQIVQHSAKREYEAIVCGNIRLDNGTVNQAIGRHKTDRKKMAICDDGRIAITHFNVLGRYQGYTHMGFSLETGRTHQIRVHMAHIGHPIIGDPIYGNKKDKFNAMNGQCLHAVRLSFKHPRTNETLHFKTEMPEYFKLALQKISKQ